jgi:site-specific DNA-methyltransferase (cytosine-N4-specific)
MENLKFAYATQYGKAFVGNSLELINQLEDESVNLAITSPPFALLREKEYGNEKQCNYVEWLAEFARRIKPKLKEDGSLVIDIGGAYERGFPVRSLYNFRVLIHFCDVLGYKLAEEFYWNNPSKLPSPIEWVNKRKIRVKDSVNTVWWFSKSAFPKADARNVLVPYSDRMKKLIENPEKFYTPKARPSGHDISSSFGNDNGGAMPSNLLSFSNSESNSKYMARCKELNIKSHPARFPKKLPEFFINYLTNENDLVVDFFAGSNTTGEVCEELKRKWYSFEIDADYVAASAFRFYKGNAVKEVYDRLKNDNSVDFTQINVEPNVLLPQQPELPF